MKMNTVALFDLFLLSVFTSIEAVNIIKVGLMMPNNTEVTLHRDVGMYNSIGAIPLAIDRIVEEELLNNFNFSFEIVNDQCDESLAAGYAATLFEKNVDVIFGPVCNAAAMIVGSLGKFYNKPVMTWGSVNTFELADDEKYPTISTIVGTSRLLGRAVMEVMREFNWKQFALLYAINEPRNRCTYIRNDIEAILNEENYTVISYQRAIAITTLDNIKSILATVSTKARIIVSCYEFDIDKRTHLLAMNDLKMNTDDYVNIFVELRGFGFGTRYTEGTEYDAITGTVPVWIPRPDYPPDGRNTDAKNGARNSFFIDFQTASDLDSKAFANGVMTRAQSWPFYCDNCSETYFNASTYAKYLHDSFYLYALALNRTLASENDTEALSKGVEIIQNTRGSFRGASGYVNIGAQGSRDATFFFTGLRADFKSQVFMTIRFNDRIPTVSLNYTNAVTTVWEMRKGKIPIDVPLCGFEGDSCPIDFWSAYAAYVIIAIISIVLLLTAIVAFGLYYRREQIKKLNELWKIAFIELDKPHKSKTGFHSERSLQSKHSNSTKMTLESMSESKNYNYFYFRHEPVAARKFQTKMVLQEKDHEELRKMTQMDSDNCNRFIGLCLDGPHVFAIWKYCNRGSLKDVIAKGSYNMDAFFVLSIMRDISDGLSYIHSQNFLQFHGRLTSRNCVVDDRWVVKLSDFGCDKFYANEKKRRMDYLWMAPELMRAAFSVGTKAGDVYSLAIISSEVLTRKPPFDYENRAAGVDELLYLIKKGGVAPIRPNLNDIDIPDLNPAVLHLIRDCWQEDSDNRPTINQVKTLMRSMSGKNQNLMDHIFSMVEQYADNLADEIAERTKELVEEKKRSDVLLYRMLPKQVADNLKVGKSVEPENFECVTVFFSDVVQFTNLASKCSPLQVVSLLNDLYSLFDGCIESYDVYKVETIGDGYMCVSGLPHRNGNEHAKEIANLSLVLVEAIKSFRIPHLPSERVNIRVGAHTGPCTAGVVGLTMPRYCLFGDTVNIASRMESNGKPGKIHISPELNNFLHMLGGFITEARGEVIIKGKGVMETFWLVSRIDNGFASGRTDRIEADSDHMFFERTDKNRMTNTSSMYKDFIDKTAVEEI